MKLRLPGMHGLPALLLLLLLLAAWCAYADSAAASVASAESAAGWPDLPLPSGLELADVGPAIRIDGLDMQVRGFVSPEPVAELTARFRASLSGPLLTSQHGGKTILGQARGGYYLTVQLETAGSGTRGLVAQIDVAALLARRVPSPDVDPDAGADWQHRLPAGMRVLSLVRSRAGERQLQHLVLQSDAALAGSGEALAHLLGRDGYRAVRSMSNRSSPSNHSSRPGLALLFQGPGREATAVLTQNADGTTSTVLSISTLVESTR
ncbi:MAG: hypothetical protein JWM30_4267 [Burkholderia sp.]|nr:hypothetical protein [Burkholderia sp.]